MISTSFFSLFSKITHIYTHGRNSLCWIHLLYSVCMCIICIYFSNLLLTAINWNQLNHFKAVNAYTLERVPTVTRIYWNACHIFNLNTTLSNSCATFYPTTHVRICFPSIFAYPPPDNHLTLIFVKLIGEKCYCILFNVTFPWLLGEVDFNYTDSQFNHHHLLKSLPFPYWFVITSPLIRSLLSLLTGRFPHSSLKISVLLSNILDIAWTDSLNDLWNSQQTYILSQL